MKTVQTNLNLHLQRISLERRSLRRDRTNYIQRAFNDNKEDHQQKIIESLAHVNLQIQYIDSYILNLSNRVRIITASISCY